MSERNELDRYSTQLQIGKASRRNAVTLQGRDLDLATILASRATNCVCVTADRKRRGVKSQ